MLEIHHILSCVYQLDIENLAEDTGTFGDDGAIKWKDPESLINLVVGYTSTKNIAFNCI